MQRFSKWQIIGLLLTFAWVVGAIYVQFSESISAASNLAKLSYDACISNSDALANSSPEKCTSLQQEKYELFMKGAWANASIVALLPLPFFWLYGFIALTTARCFKNGSNTVLNLSSFSKPQKWFAYFCFVYAALTVLFFILVAMNKHVDSKVPTYLGFDTRIFEYDDYVSAEGTWVNGNTLEPNATVFSPHQTSKIVCRKNKFTCVESKASIMFASSTPSLNAELIEYEIKSWTTNSIVYSEQNLCSETIFTIDLNSKTVSGVEKFANNAPNKNFCKPSTTKKNATYKLENGYTVYNNLRKDASPYFLKLIFAFFGN